MDGAMKGKNEEAKVVNEEAKVVNEEAKVVNEEEKVVNEEANMGTKCKVCGASMAANNEAVEPNWDLVIAESLIDDQPRRPRAVVYGSLHSYNHRCSLIGCCLSKACGFSPEASIMMHYCSTRHERLATQLSEDIFALHYYDGFESTVERNIICSSSLRLKAQGINVGIPTFDNPAIFTTYPWDQPLIFRIPNPPSDTDWLFFHTPPKIYRRINKSLGIYWNGNGRKKFTTDDGVDIVTQTITLRFNKNNPLSLAVKHDQRGVWRFYLYIFGGFSLYCLTYEMGGDAKDDREEDEMGGDAEDDREEDHDGKEEDHDGKDEDKTDDKKGKKPKKDDKAGKGKKGQGKKRKQQDLTKSDSHHAGLGFHVVDSIEKTLNVCSSKYGCSVFNDFGLDGVLNSLMEGFVFAVSKVFFTDVCQSTFASHHGYVFENGEDRDAEFGFHVVGEGFRFTPQHVNNIWSSGQHEFLVQKDIFH